jgi:DNA-binding NtrC family response regulator
MIIVEEKTNSHSMNVPKLNLDEVRPHIVFDAGEGKVWLNEQRIMLFSQLALGKFRREVLETIGFERTKSFFLRLGYRLGKLDADLALTSKAESTVLEQFMTGPQLHALRGMVLPELTELNLEPSESFYASVTWHDSYEVELTQQEIGHLDSPGCWTLVGYASGYSSQVLKKEIYFQELTCRCCGDEQCIGIGKELKDWDNGEELKEYYSKDSLIDELNSLQSYVETLESGVREKDDMADIVGESKPFKQALNMVTKASDSRVSVLLLGETGVGKEVMARALHRSSERADKPFVAVNCAAIPPDLIESELFGVAKGAFTGASHSREGRFERANQGTIFLDEVVELSPRAQASLLRILQEHEFERVGDNQVRKVDVRVVAATNEDLSEAVSQGRFRADLYYRLSAFPVKIPSLRQRKEDIPLFVDFFLKKYQKMYNKKISGVSDKGMAALMSYEWPGNIRELENVVERALILTDAGGYIAVDLILGPTAKMPCEEQFHIDKDGSLVDDKNAAMVKGAKDLAAFALDNQMNLEELEVAILNQALERAGGKVSKAARLAGMTRPAFAYRLKKNGIDI